MKAPHRDLRYLERNMNLILGLLTLLTPCLVALLILSLSGMNPLSLWPETHWPVSRLALRPYFAHPSAFTPAQTLLPSALSPLTSEVSSPDRTSETEVSLPGASVADYLHRLQQIDQEKQTLLLRAVELSPKLQIILSSHPLLATVPPPASEPPPGSAATSEYQVAILPTEEWNRFIDAFDRQPYPLSCHELHDRYILHLKALRDLFVAALASLAERHEESKGKAQAADAQALGQARGDLEAETRAADGALSDLCGEHHLQKPFDITAPTAEL